MEDRFKVMIESENAAHQVMMSYYSEVAEIKRQETERWAVGGFIGSILSVIVVILFIMAFSVTK